MEDGDVEVKGPLVEDCLVVVLGDFVLSVGTSAAPKRESSDEAEVVLVPETVLEDLLVSDGGALPAQPLHQI